jgi:hypothetical protein
VLDRYHAGWFSVTYWADVADLAAQAAELATPGAALSDAATAAQLSQLLQERHSIFHNRCGCRQQQVTNFTGRVVGLLQPHHYCYWELFDMLVNWQAWCACWCWQSLNTTHEALLQSACCCFYDVQAVPAHASAVDAE